MPSAPADVTNHPAADPARLTRWVLTRIALAGVLLSLLLGVVGWRAYRVQADDGERLRELADQQYLKRMELPPRRGAILDRHGSPLAVSVEVPSVYANPRQLANVRAAAAQLATALGLDARALERRLRRRRYFVWIKRRITAREATAVRALKIKGVALTKESKRFYPNQGLGGLVVGFAGIDSKGLEGIEHSHDQLLKGRRQRVVGLRDALGRLVFSPEPSRDAPLEGHDLVLSLDRLIQYETESALAEAYKDVRPGGWIAAVVLDPQTGDVLAMSSAPSFDPNHYAKAKVAHRRNRTITDAFEPGSTLKIFTIAGALDRGVIRADESFDCERGAWRVGRHVIHDSKPHKILTLAQVMKKSSNIGTSKIALKLGKRGLYRALRDFGFGEVTGAELSGERRGVLRSPRRWSDVGLANISFGQGMTATVLQLARGAAAVANGGRLMRPRLVLKVRDASGAEVQSYPPEGKRVIRADVAATVRRMMVGVTEEGGTAEPAALDHYSVAGKTGTAQKVDPLTGTYSKELWVSSFVGIAPASAPRIVVAVVINEPAGKKYYGGEVAGPIFRRIAGKALRYLGVAPDKRPPPIKAGDRRAVVVASEVGQIAPAEAALAPPLPGARARRGGGATTVPDFTGMSIGEVLSAARRAKLRVKLQGSGRAVAQSPGPGPAATQTLCRISFRPPG